VLLLSDGLANQGDSSLAGLTRRAQRAVRGEFVLSTMGIGNDFDETVMTSLARAGTGAFYYLAKLETLPAFLDAELKTANETYAQAAQIRFQPAPGVRVVSASGVTIEQRGDGMVVVPLGGLYAGQKQKVWLTLRVSAPELRDHELGELALSYRRNGRSIEIPGVSLPKVASVVDPAVFRARIVQPVWERATIEAEVSAAQERLAVAIGSGNSSDVDSALSAVPEQRRLAQELRSQKVLDELIDLEKRAALAREAQAAAPAERSIAAKRQSAEGFSRSRPSAYKNIQSDYGY
jgi:Ca-activated chloride channel family protein